MTMQTICRAGLICVLSPLFGACGDDNGNATPLEYYKAAIIDAQIAEASEVVDTLTAISPDNDQLMRDENGRILMVTWTSYDGYDDEVGQDTELGIEVWTTVAPVVQTFCRESGLQGDALNLRLEQLIGLPPDDGNDRMVELWVEPEDMFRPAPDSEITDSVAELNFPADTVTAHRDWIDELTAESYELDGGYPWTRLGYTYDWNPDSSEVGPSEFVINRGASVGVESVTATDDYCRGN